MFANKNIMYIWSTEFQDDLLQEGLATCLNKKCISIFLPDLYGTLHTKIVITMVAKNDGYTGKFTIKLYTSSDIFNDVYPLDMQQNYIKKFVRNKKRDFQNTVTLKKLFCVLLFYI